HFACYGAGTPSRDAYPHALPATRDYTAEEPFVAALPRRLLAHPNGPALAVGGHVERAGGYSRPPPGGMRPQIRPFPQFGRPVLAGERVGHAARDFGEKYTLLAAQLLNLQNVPPDRPPDEYELARLWIDCNDFQNYVLLGDPAARLRGDQLR